MPATAIHNSLQHQLEHELWLKELGFLNDEINFMKRHLADLYFQDHSEELMQKVRNFSESFRLQKEWLQKMRNEIAFQQDKELEDAPGKKSLGLQMQANRLVNQELKDNFFKLFS